MRRRTLYVIVAAVAAAVGAWFALVELSQRRAGQRLHAYHVENGALPNSIANEIVLAVEELKQRPPQDPQVCVRWLVRNRPEINQTKAGIDEENGLIYDSRQRPLRIEVGESSVRVVALGWDGRYGTEDDVEAVKEFVPYLKGAR